MSRCLAVCLLIVVTSAGGFSRSQVFGAVITTTVCDLSENPERYSKFKTVVRVRAFILSDLIHHTNLEDAACDAVGVSLESEEFDGRPIELVKDEEYDKLEVLHPKLLELRDKDQKLYGTFEGLFLYRPNHNPMRTLVLRRVSDLYVGHDDDPKYALKNK